MKRVYVVTFCTYKSIGSILQSYALTKTLKELGNESTVLIQEQKKSSKKKVGFSFKRLIKNAYKIFLNKKTTVSRKKRLSFMSENINIERFQRYEELEKKAKENENDIYLAGSDQIWNPDLCNPAFFLDFAKNNTCISYAASMGKTVVSPEKAEVFGNLIQNFQRISVRERDCVDAIRAFTDKDIDVHIDPTFLIKPDIWKKMEKSRDINEPFILLYMIYWDKSCKDKIIELKKRTGLPVYAICNELSRVYADKYLYDVGVEEFLWLFDHAEYVVTSSFHGVAFSIIFQKKFSAVINPRLPSRINNIMNVLSVPLVEIDELDRTESFKYDSIAQKIEAERQRSIDYLKEAIG